MRILLVRILRHHRQLKASTMGDLGIGAVKVFTSLVTESDFRKRITRVYDKIARILFNHDTEKCHGNGA